MSNDTEAAAAALRAAREAEAEAEAAEAEWDRSRAIADAAGAAAGQLRQAAWRARIDAWDAVTALPSSHEAALEAALAAAKGGAA